MKYHIRYRCNECTFDRSKVEQAFGIEEESRTHIDLMNIQHGKVGDVIGMHFIIIRVL